MTDSHDNLHNFIRLLTTAAANAAMYQLDHPQVARLCRQAFGELQTLLKQHNPVTLKIIENQLIFDNRPVSDNISVHRFIAALGKQQIGFLQFEPGIYNEELLGLINTLSKRQSTDVDLSESEHIHFSKIEVRYRSQSSRQQTTQLLLSDIANKEADRQMHLYQSVQQHQQVDISEISELVSGFINAFSQHSDAFLALAPLRSMDEYTYTHSTNICLLNLAQAQQLGIKGQQLNEIGIAAMLHDVGKMFISPGILSKKGKLTDEEWQQMQQHPRLGAEYLLSTPGVPRLAVVTAYEHHMGFDGKGYPQPGRPWKMNLCSHMTAISDTYDAMRTKRSYEDSLQQNEIINIMLNLAGTRLHPQLTYSFLQMLSTLDKGKVASQQ
ncbi:HD domain-containing protein [Malonomonas rubra DSM 5091]|uniref:HD domain-containing protein n=1 Tax=Malonomonas rubra DSM 5091 TaxID=1122189 RepID=A0A1M6DZP1_MALRU|nr:HD domain-containing phosphohydrolase [Malonomonas rubra]SHI78498.1 HD domain-containing protein [Malonomonas rubra DSM 5091]